MSWRVAEEKIGKWCAIKHSRSGELCLAGRYGEIWISSPTTYKAVITNARVANKHFGTALKQGEEMLHEFPITELSRWVKLLKIARQRVTMIKLAEGFGKCASRLTSPRSRSSL